MTNKEYRQAEGVARSDLYTIFTKTPMHFKYQLEHPKEDTSSLAFGRAAHKYILEKDDFFNEFAVAPECDRRTKEGKEIYAEFVASSEGKDVISAADFEQICEMAQAIDDDPFAREFFNADAIYEKSYFWTDSATGEVCKVRPDCITEFEGKKYIVDYKTTDSCADGHFERSVKKYGYKFQAGMYREGVFQNELEDFGFVFVAQEKTAPYAVRVYFCSEAFIQEGYDQFREAIGILHYCKTYNNFYGYEGADSRMTELMEDGANE